MLRSITLTVTFAAVAALGARADDPGTVATDVFVFGRSARYEALAAGVALPGDAGALLRNPATLADIDRLTLIADYRDWYLDTSLAHAEVALPAPWGCGALAAAGVRLSEGSVRDLDLVHGAYGETYDNASLGLALGYGQTLPWWGDVDAGLSGLLLSRTLLGQSASGLGVGGGLAAGVWDDALRLGCSFRYIGNLSGEIEGISNVSPWNVTAGATVRIDRFLHPAVGATVSADAVRRRNADTRGRFGLEVIVMDAVSLRVGYDSLVDEASMRYGIGVRAGAIDVDLVFCDHDALGTTGGLAVSFRLGSG